MRFSVLSFVGVRCAESPPNRWLVDLGKQAAHKERDRIACYAMLTSEVYYPIQPNPHNHMLPLPSRKLRSARALLELGIVDLIN